MKKSFLVLVLLISSNGLLAETFSWSTASAIPGQVDNQAYVPKIVFDATTGKSISAWYQSDGSADQIYYSIYDGSSWTDAAKIPNQPANTGRNPEIATDGLGNALAVWRQSDGSIDQIYYAYLNVATESWTLTATTIPGQPSNAGDLPQIAFNSSGDAIAVWVQNDGSEDQVYYAYFDGGTESWTTIATKIPGQLATAVVAAPHIGFDGGGNAIVVWSHFANIYNIYYSIFNGTSWTNAVQIPGQSLGDANGEPRIAVDSTGKAITVWIRSNDSTLYYSLYDGSSWSNAALMSGSNNILYGDNIQQMAYDSSGNILTVWQQNDGSNYQIYYAYYDGLSEDWTTTATTIPGQLAETCSAPQVAFDSGGNALSVWSQTSGTFYSFFNGSTKSWTDAAAIVEIAGTAQPKFVFNTSDEAIAVLDPDKIYYSLYRFVPPIDTSNTIYVVEYERSLFKLTARTRQ